MNDAEVLSDYHHLSSKNLNVQTLWFAAKSPPKEVGRTSDKVSTASRYFPWMAHSPNKALNYRSCTSIRVWISLKFLRHKVVHGHIRQQAVCYRRKRGWTDNWHGSYACQADFGYVLCTTARLSGFLDQLYKMHILIIYRLKIIITLLVFI